MHHDSISSLKPEGNLADMGASQGIFTGFEKVLGLLIKSLRYTTLVVIAGVVIVSVVGYWKSAQRNLPSRRNVENLSLPVPPVPTLVNYTVYPGGWSPRISPKAYSAEDFPGRTIRINGSDARKLSWPPGPIKVPADAVFIEIGFPAGPDGTIGFWVKGTPAH
jgi:hypothetical protein